MKILITGGAGFIGSHLCKKLLNDGHEILCVDNLLTGSRDNIQSLIADEKFKFTEHDIISPLDTEIDQIYNLACPASPIHYQADPIFTLKTSVYGTLNMLELARKNKAKILHASTSEVYGDPDPRVHPQPENYWGNVNPIGPRACYDEGKRCAETFCFDYQRKYNLPIRVARIFNTYGPKMHPNDGRVVSNFITQALQNKDLTVYGDGSQTRSFQYIDDLVEGIIGMMENKKDFAGPVNLGNPEEFTIKELAEKVLEMIPESKSKIAYRPLPQDDPKQRKPDITLAKEKLNWAPKVELDEGLKKTIEYFRKVI